MIEILNASAGSGKTYNLTKKYIELLLKNDDPFAYRHILAVTFTNKATDEMKGRILKDLYKLTTKEALDKFNTDPKHSGYMNEFVPQVVPTAEKLQSKAKEILYNILHDYSAFSVSTIDRFFQQTLKAFSHEIGQFSNYQVELDKDSLVEESVDRILESLDQRSPELLNWLYDSAIELLEQGKPYRLKANLLDKAQELQSEEHRTVCEAAGVDEKTTYSKNSLKKMKVFLRGFMKGFQDDLEAAAKALSDAFAQCGVDPGVTSRSIMAMHISKFTDMTPYGELPTFSDTYRKDMNDFKSWFKKTDAPKYASLESSLLPPAQHLLSVYDNGIRFYNTARIIEGLINGLGIENELNEAFHEVMSDHNVLCIDESNFLLKKIINGSDAPFVYEKLGVRYEHFLLDEFQDTSRIQWENFKPLVINSDSQQFENLFVGDVKQSIYRWRGSDWDLMANQVKKDLQNVTERSLQGNWRSLRNIVEFNNRFFNFAALLLDTYGNAVNDSVAKIYCALSEDDIKAGKKDSPLIQQVCVHDKDGQEGSVEAIFCEKDLELENVLKTIRKVMGHGAKAGDIAVLVRGNAEGSEIANYLISNDLDVISDEALRLKSSSVVRKIVSLISSVNNPEDTIGSYIARQTGLEAGSIRFSSLMDLCEILLRKIRAGMDEETFNDEVLYIQSFMDYVKDFTAINGNSLDAFLKKWKDDDPQVSSPSDENAIRVMTIHKAKGLAFPYVIFPYTEKVELFNKDTEKWIVPQVEGTPLQGLGKAAFNVRLSSKSEATLFDKDYEKELFMQHTDNINVFYVALTRAAKGMTIIAKKGCSPKSNFAGILETFIHQHGEENGFVNISDSILKDPVDDKNPEADEDIFMKGTMYDFSRMDRESKDEGIRTPGFPSFALGSDGTFDNGALRVRTNRDSADFFSEEGKERAKARLNGVVLHDILSQVIVPEDLSRAVENARNSGDLDKKDAEADESLLSKRIASHPEWFAAEGAEILTETSLFDINGQEYRPDRVMIKDGRVTVIDYKFGEKDPRYVHQVRHYIEIYRRMGYGDVSGRIWYVPDDETENVEVQ